MSLQVDLDILQAIMNNTPFKTLSDLICHWYLKNKRDLPWRRSRDPYRIWISEIMLQQTTVQAVIPFYERFLTQFPTVHELAQSRLEDVLKYWAGLGYYSRARNIHKAAQIFSRNGFPSKFEQLIDAPGLGPYTSRAISSLAFDEPVGVLDGNVIRILSRVLGLKTEWWKTQYRNQLQNFSDELAQFNTPSIVNQATMELGATICTPQSPACTLCPWLTHCKAYQKNQVSELPLKKDRKQKEFWLWSPHICIHKNKLAMLETHELPFLKKLPLPPGKGTLVKSKPKKFDFQHTITHHHIFIQIESHRNLQSLKKSLNLPKSKVQWYDVSEISEYNPTSLLKKTLKAYKFNE